MMILVMVGLRSSISILNRLPSHFHGSNSNFLMPSRVLRGRRNLQIRASFGVCDRSPSRPWGSLGQKAENAGSMVTVAAAAATRVMYRLALVPMKRYPFFLARFTTFGYVVLYFSILYTRYRQGIVSDKMLTLPKWRFVAIGMLEALGVAPGMSAGAMLPGQAIPLLSQTFIVWQLGFSIILWGRKYSFDQNCGCLLVAAVGLIPVRYFIWPAVMITSSAFQAVVAIIKESVFIDEARHLKGRSLDIFVVNSFGSGFQALFVLLLLPLLSNLRGILFNQLPSYLKDRAGCFFNTGTKSAGCDGAPTLASTHRPSIWLSFLPQSSLPSP